MLFVGDGWAEDHHDVEVQEEAGRGLVKARLPKGLAGITRLPELVGAHLPEDADPAQVVIGIESDRGPWVSALVTAGYQVIAMNPLQAARYRERCSTSGATSDAGDAHALADMVRTDRHQLRAVAGDSALTEAVKSIVWAHQTLVWDRTRQVQRCARRCWSRSRPLWPCSTAWLPRHGCLKAHTAYNSNRLASSMSPK